ncbi:NifU family protein [Membranicola marinus]|uniref:NifU family protein n=1 Tax=Membranihabitans marinus TaxID=1227546 RepID=A0A953HJ38_9BACT|nr:NifU family protein [Membranihabitans marinus]MBY5956647.1 NifU family protein [Membranihabitans marinus]
METQTKTKNPVLLYTERTPNPEALKFVTNTMLYRGTADFQEVELANEYSPLATELFEFPYVKGVYISNNFVTVTKELNYSWDDIMLKIKAFIKSYVESDKAIINESFEAYIQEQEAAKREKEGIAYTGDEGEIVARIKDLIDTYVKPAVAGDGGNIEFESFEDGVVSVLLQGACSGCPSSLVTLKQGIEGMLKRMIPEVQSVEAHMD